MTGQKSGESRRAPKGVEPQILIEAEINQRSEIENAGNRVACQHQIGRRLGIERLPIGRDHGVGKMAAGGMAADQHGLAKALPQENTGAADLLDDVADTDNRTEIIADNGDNDTVWR